MGGTRWRAVAWVLAVWALVPALTLGPGAGSGAAAAASAGGAAPLTVHVQDGAVRAVRSGGVRQFWRIPYAAPPVGALRWEPPQAPTPWSGTLAATRPGPECPQVLAFGNKVMGRENCLTVNVTAPAATAGHPLPVMVFIHGGTFLSGAGALYPMAHLAARGVVGVTLNYRLGLLGFLAVPALQRAGGAVGNLGLLDQQAALRWVQDNIAAFGGDPHDVTIFGQSAGGISVCAQVLSPLARGLFQRAISESGPCLGQQFQTRSQAEQVGAALVAKAGCAAATPAQEAACLRAAPVATLVHALPADAAVDIPDVSHFPQPVEDGVVLPRDVDAALRAGRFNRVPMIVGANRDEGRLFTAILYTATGHPVTASAYPSVVRAYYSGHYSSAVAAEVLRRYPLSAYPDPTSAFGESMGDSFLFCPVVKGAGLLAAHTPVYLYEYTHTPNPLAVPTAGENLGAFHGAELPYVFGVPLNGGTLTPVEQRLSDAVERAWISFAATGTPSPGTGPWPRLHGSGGDYLVLDTPAPHVARGMKAHTCAFWDAQTPKIPG